MPEPIAYFLTWTCYGTWMHGDERGSADRQHNTPGTPYLEENQPRLETERDLMEVGEFGMRRHARAAVHGAIVEHALHKRWPVHALNVRSNHVHLVLTAPKLKPEQVMSQMKAWATKALRKRGFLTQSEKAWTHHGSTRWINTEYSLNAAINYVLNHQDEPRKK